MVSDREVPGLSERAEGRRVAGLAEGQAAHLTFSALNDAEVEGTVSYVAPSSTNVGGAVAYSTLGWFDDPVFSTMLATMEVTPPDADLIEWFQRQ